ncbi:MAG: DUF4091 domain-containing protein, partial [Candidatus Hydrogenedentes bacterium]|nr:DUF4091 domain-containing protein [Candidatus Hydrogenedentota bacterium]
GEEIKRSQQATRLFEITKALLQKLLDAGWDLPVDIWIPLLREYDPVLARMARERGIEVWWYSIGWEIHEDPLWSKALHWASFANEVDGWLYYHLYDWVDREQRLEDNAPLTAWRPYSEGTRSAYGTGAIVYWDRDGNPRPSLRLVNLREGFFDYDLLCLLRDRLEAVENAGPPSSFEEKLRRERARALLALPWRTTLNEYVVDDAPGNAPAVARAIAQFRADALRLVDELGG